MTVDREKVIEGLQKTLMWADTPELLEGMSPKELYTEYECWRPEAEAVLKYFEAQDLVIVPVEPTEEMVMKGLVACNQELNWLCMYPLTPQSGKSALHQAYKAMIQSQKGGSDD